MTDAVAAETQHAYDATATRYHARWHLTDPVEDVKRLFVAHLPARSRIVDVGCGTGRDLEWFTSRGLQAVGVDRSVGMLALVETVVPLVRADVRRLPFAEESMDAWWASASLLHLPAADFSLTLSELRRVTRSGGMGFLSVKEGEGDGFEFVDDGPYRRYFCHWRDEALDHALRASHWDVQARWTSPDTLGRQPWLCRLVRRERG